MFPSFPRVAPWNRHNNRPFRIASSFVCIKVASGPVWKYDLRLLGFPVFFHILPVGGRYLSSRSLIVFPSFFDRFIMLWYGVCMPDSHINIIPVLSGVFYFSAGTDTVQAGKKNSLKHHARAVTARSPTLCRYLSHGLYPDDLQSD